MTDEQEQILTMLRKFDVEAFRKYMEEHKEESLPEHATMAVMHKARVKLGYMGHINKRLISDSKRWLKSNGH